MSQYILLRRIQVQNASAIAGFTWGFPAITHFLGFTHLLSRKLAKSEQFNSVSLSGCAVIAHNHQVHTYRVKTSQEFEFTQSRNPPYLNLAKDDNQKEKKKVNTAAIIEEGKINMTVSLLMAYDGDIGGNHEERFKQWLLKNSLIQRLAGGTILNIAGIELVSDEASHLTKIKRRLLPGFVLLDQSHYLEEQYQSLVDNNDNAEVFDAWLDFCALKQKARPKSDLISKHFQQIIKQQTENSEFIELSETWQKHLKQPYQQTQIPESIKHYFDSLEANETHEKLSEQWETYCEPDKTTDADWEYISKLKGGYLVPIMIGYKAISEPQSNESIANTRDSKTDETQGTDVCFVEAAHSIGEWKSVHRLKTIDELDNCVWQYHYEKDWYLCTQDKTKTNMIEPEQNAERTQSPEDDI